MDTFSFEAMQEISDRPCITAAFDEFIHHKYGDSLISISETVENLEKQKQGIDKEVLIKTHLGTPLPITYDLKFHSWDLGNIALEYEIEFPDGTVKEGCHISPTKVNDFTFNLFPSGKVIEYSRVALLGACVTYLPKWLMTPYKGKGAYRQGVTHDERGVTSRYIVVPIDEINMRTVMHPLFYDVGNDETRAQLLKLAEEARKEKNLTANGGSTV
jgi:hypothetical protein